MNGDHYAMSRTIRFTRAGGPEVLEFVETEETFAIKELRFFGSEAELINADSSEGDRSWLTSR
jgi:hypothetical protein